MEGEGTGVVRGAMRIMGWQGGGMSIWGFNGGEGGGGCCGLP